MRTEALRLQQHPIAHPAAGTEIGRMDSRANPRSWSTDAPSFQLAREAVVDGS